MITAAQALTGTGPVYSHLYYQRAVRYQELLDECRGLCQHEIYGNRAPDDKILISTRLEFVIEELRSLVTRLEQMQEDTEVPGVCFCDLKDECCFQEEE